MEIVIIVGALLLSYVAWTFIKFTMFKSRLMNEFGRQGVEYDIADRVYAEQSKAINDDLNAGLSFKDIVLRAFERA